MKRIACNNQCVTYFPVRCILLATQSFVNLICVKQRPKSLMSTLAYPSSSSSAEVKIPNIHSKILHARLPITRDGSHS